MNLQNGRPHRIDLMPRLESSSSFSNLGGESCGFTVKRMRSVGERKRSNFWLSGKEKMESVIHICYGFRFPMLCQPVVPLRRRVQ